MQIIVTGKDFHLTPSLKQFVETQAKKLERFRGDIETVKFELDVDRRHKSGENFRVEGWVHLPRIVLSAGDRAADMRIAVERVAHKLSRLIEKDKEKRIERRRGR